MLPGCDLVGDVGADREALDGELAMADSGEGGKGDQNHEAHQRRFDIFNHEYIHMSGSHDGGPMKCCSLLGPHLPAFSTTDSFTIECSLGSNLRATKRKGLSFASCRLNLVTIYVPDSCHAGWAGPKGKGECCQRLV